MHAHVFMDYWTFLRIQKYEKDQLKRGCERSRTAECSR